MRPSRTRASRILALGILAAALLGAQAGTAVATPTRTLVPIGSDYQPDTLQLFAREAARADGDGTVHILVLPITYSLSGLQTTKTERKKNLTLADNRRGQVETACNVVKDPGQTCLVELVPAVVRDDALNPANLAFFTLRVDGMFSLGGDQGVAMQVVQATPLEAAMTAAYDAGAVFGGNSAGDAVQSRIMLNGYLGSNGPAESMRQGVLDVRDDDPAWDGELGTLPTRGLAFGFPNLITDQHVFEYGRTGRSLNMALQYDLPVLGMDAATGAVVTDYTILRDVTGDTEGYVIDPNAFGATHSYAGPNGTLSAKGVAVHLVAPSDGFNFGTMLPSLDNVAIAKPSIAGRTYGVSASGGVLYLSGGIVGDAAGTVGQAFLDDASTGGPARIVVLAAGYAKSGDAQADAKAIAAALAPSVASVSWFALDSRLKVADANAALANATGIIVTGRDASLVKAQLLASPAWATARQRWAVSQVPLLADDAAAAAVGSSFVAQAPVADVEAGAISDAGGVTIDTGLGLVTNLNVQPRLLPDQHWPRVFKLATVATVRQAAGIDVGTALRVSGSSISAVGDSAAVIVDGRSATIDTTTGNGSTGAAWLILDAFTDGQAVTP